MDFQDQNLTYSQTFKNLFIKGSLKNFFILDLLNLSLSKITHKRKKKLEKIRRNKVFKSTPKLVQMSLQ